MAAWRPRAAQRTGREAGGKGGGGTRVAGEGARGFSKSPPAPHARTPPPSAAQISAGVLAEALKRAADSDDDDDDDSDGGLGPAMGRAGGFGTTGAGSGAAGGDVYADLEDEDVAPEDEAALAAFMAPGSGDHRQLSLGDVVLSKLREKQREQGLRELPAAG